MTERDYMPDAIDAVTRTMEGFYPTTASGQVDPAAAESQRRLSDVVQPDGFPRSWLDRNFSGINSRFVGEFGYANSPLEVARKRLQALGSVTLLDVGCGTGNTLRTWAGAVRRHTADPSDVTAIGLNLHDYSDESMSQTTREAIRRGDIRYIVDDAEKMTEVSEESADVVLAYMSLIHMRRPYQAVRRIDRAMRPGGTAFLQLTGDMLMPGSPLDRQVYIWADEGYVIRNTPVRDDEIVHMRIRKPEAS